MAKFCPNCGIGVDEDSEFCTECGTNLKTAVKPKSTDGRIKISNFIGENDNIKVLDEQGPFKIIEYEKDLSVTPQEAIYKYFSSKMNVRPRQLVVDLSKTQGIYLQAGAMQWMSGSNKLSSGIKGIGDFGKKFLKSTVTGETTVKPEYSGDGYLVTEQTYKHLILLDLKDWNHNLMIDDGLFLAAEKSVNLSVKKRTNLSSALAAAEGLPVLVHSSNDEYSQPRFVYEAAKAHPNINFIMAHVGLITDNNEAIELIGSLPNLYGDTAWVKPESGLKLMKKYGAHKLLFGTDNPIDGPDTYAHPFYKTYFNEFRKWVTPDDYELLMHGNAERIFHL